MAAGSQGSRAPAHPEELYPELAALMMRDSMALSQGPADGAERQLRLEQELHVLAKILSCKEDPDKAPSKESDSVLAELWDHVESELVSLLPKLLESVPRVPGLAAGEVAPAFDDTAEVEEELRRLTSQPAWKLAPCLPPGAHHAKAPPVPPAPAEKIPARAPARAREEREPPPSHDPYVRQGEVSASTPSSARAPEAPSSFRSAAEMFPEVAKRSPPAASAAEREKRQCDFDEASLSILKRGEARGKGTKRLHPEGKEEKAGKDWSDAWLRIADADLLEKLVPALEATIHRSDASEAVRKEDIAGLSFVKAQIEEVLILPRLHPELFLSALTKPARGLLLFGPPGTGKTLLAKWIAAECGATFFNVNASTVMSKWIGEAEKTVKALFQLAADRQPSVIFLDEIDSLLSQRRDADNEASRRVKNEFLTSLEGADTAADDKVLLVGATNMPWDLDHAVLRRLPKRLYVPLPGPKARRSLLAGQLEKHNSRLGLAGNLSLADLDNIVERTDGFSCSDLQHLLCEAAMGPVREVAAARIRQKSDSPPVQQTPRDIAKRDFDCALRRVKPTHSSEQGLRHRTFNDEHGTCRGEDAMQDVESDAE